MQNKTVSLICGVLFVILVCQVIGDESSARIEPFYPVTEEGSDMTIRCYSPPEYQLQYSDIKFQIQHDGRNVRGPESPEGFTDKFVYFTYTKSSIQAVDEGNYTCVIMASNPGDVPSVDVYAHSYVRVLKPNTQPVISIVGSDARLYCISDPSLQDELLVRWKVKDKLVGNNEKYHEKYHMTDDHSLVVKNVGKEDAYVTYDCIVASRSAEKYYGSFDNATQSDATIRVGHHVIAVETKKIDSSPIQLSTHVYGTGRADNTGGIQLTGGADVRWTVNNGTLLDATIEYTDNVSISTVEIPGNMSGAITLLVQVGGTQWNTSIPNPYSARAPTSADGLVAHIAVGVVAVVIIVIGVIVGIIVWRRRKAKQARANAAETKNENGEGIPLK